jgi:corin
MVHFDMRFDARYGSVDTESVLSVLSRELTSGSSRFFANLTVDPASLEVQESASATSNLALETNASQPEEVTPTTMPPRPPRRCSIIEFSYCKHLPYNLTSYPNLLGHASLQEVNDDIIAFR